MDKQEIIEQLKDLTEQIITLQSQLSGGSSMAYNTPLISDYNPADLTQYDNDFLDTWLDPSADNFSSDIRISPTLFEHYKYISSDLSSITSDATLAESTEPTKPTETVIEPFTAGWVALQIAEGIIAWAAGRVLERVFGGGGIDFEKFMRNLVEALRQVVRQELEQNALREYIAGLSALEDELEHFRNAPTIGRLENATHAANQLASGAKSLRLTGYDAFFVAICLQIVVLQERVAFFRGNPSLVAGEKRNILSVVSNALQEVDTLNRGWRSWHDDRFKCNTGRGRYVILKDGKIFESGGRINRSDEWVQARFVTVKQEQWAAFTIEKCDIFEPTIIIWRRLRSELD